MSHPWQYYRLHFLHHKGKELFFNVAIKSLVQGIFDKVFADSLGFTFTLSNKKLSNPFLSIPFHLRLANNLFCARNRWGKKKLASSTRTWKPEYLCAILCGSCNRVGWEPAYYFWHEFPRFYTAVEQRHGGDTDSQEKAFLPPMFSFIVSEHDDRAWK